MPQLAGGGGGGDPELCATDEMIPFKDEGDPQKEQIFAEINHSEEEGDLDEIKSSLVNETETSPHSNNHDVSCLFLASTIDLFYADCEMYGSGDTGVCLHGELIMTIITEKQQSTRWRETHKLVKKKCVYY